LLNQSHFLFLNYQTITKKSLIRDFNCGFFKNWALRNLVLGHARSNKYFMMFIVTNKQTNKNTYIQGDQKKVWFAAPCAKSHLSFVTLITQKKIREAFFLSTSKVQKSKNVYINYVYQNLKNFKHWIKESQKIRKIVMRKFAIFSSGLVFKEKLFEFSSLSS